MLFWIRVQDIIVYSTGTVPVPYVWLTVVILWLTHCFGTLYGALSLCTFIVHQQTISGAQLHLVGSTGTVPVPYVGSIDPSGSSLCHTTVNNKCQLL